MSALFRFSLPCLFLLLTCLLVVGKAGAAEAERPHVILIMVDDMGFSDLGYHGGEIETPNLDALAHGGVRFSHFYNSGRCCPTRATLMTGLHPHQTGIGHMTQAPGRTYPPTTPANYQGYLNRQCVTVAEVLSESGYATMMSGKWHLGQETKDRWPLLRGFEKFYGCLPGALKLFHPVQPRGITLGNEPLDPPESTTDDAFYTTDAFTDYAIQFLKEEQQGRKRPSFLYLAYNAPHWPLQAFEEDIAKYRGKYKGGWEKLRKDRYQRQIELGLIDPDWKLSPPTPGIPEWESLDGKKRDEMDLKMAVYAAMIDRVDQNIGKLVSFLKESGTFDDTLILFLSDNGACQEGGMLGRGEFYDIEKRNQEDSNSYGEAWANAGSTPFRLYKHFAHEGGAATPFFMHWPKRIKTVRDWYGAPAQLIDIVPTILDVAGAKYPEKYHGNDIPALDGISMRPAFSAAPLGRDEPIFIEHENNAFVRDGDWKLVGQGVAANAAVDASKWELYNMVGDRTETHNLAATQPDKVNELAEKWNAWAERVGVYPKPRPKARNAKAAPQAVADPPQISGRELIVSATVQGPKLNGVALAHGGVRFGYALYFVDGKPAVAIRNEGKLVELIAKDTVKGKVTVTAELREDTLKLLVNEKEVASVPSGGLIKEQPGLGLYLGEDFQDPVGSYKVPNKLQGKVLAHKIEVIVPKVSMRTEWGEKVTAENVWQEYPRPALRRDNWTNLNGHWDYAITGKNSDKAPEKWQGKILVPFAIESPLSGVERRLAADEALWYRREIEIKKGDKRHLLNFEAVDYHSTVWINDIQVGEHTGGNLPFSFDVADALKDGENLITLRVTDATDENDAYQLHGKQRKNPKGIWYTPVSGIWQTVWMEEVFPYHYRDLKITTRMDGTVTVDVEMGGEKYAKSILKGRIGKKDSPVSSPVSAGDSVAADNGRFIFKIEDPQLWSPDSPTLYDLTLWIDDITNEPNEVIHSYVGIRETGITKDADDHLRFTLNGKPIFHWGTLDQGWWPDGLLTPPSDAAMVSDIEFLKASGFNTIRKHIKVEPRRYYTHCDRIGMMVWQDQVSSMSDNPEWTRLKPNPQTVTWPEAAHAQFMTELQQMIDTLHNHPSIVQWVPFNERWGQHQTIEVGDWTTQYDPTRQVNVASGGNWFPSGHIVDEHRYPHPGFPFELGADGRFDGYVKVMGEFGGHGFPVEGHLWSKNTRNWGYGGLPKDKDEWLERYRESIRILTELKKQGIAAGIYTQTTDVEGEINGLITYDRKMPKIDASTLREIAAPLTAE
jgi:arylsulfatase